MYDRLKKEVPGKSKSTQQQQHQPGDHPDNPVILERGSNTVRHKGKQRKQGEGSQ